MNIAGLKTVRRPPLVKNSPEFKRVNAVTLKENRKKRLKTVATKRIRNTFWDLLKNVGFPVFGGIAAAAVTTALLTAFPDTAATIKQEVYSPDVVAALGTVLAFIVSLRMNANLQKNSSVISTFGALTGSCVNIAIWTRSLVTKEQLDGADTADERQTDDSIPITFAPTQIASILTTIPHVVKKVHRGNPVTFSKLPIAAFPMLHHRVEQMVDKNMGLQMGAFTACIVLLGEELDALEARKHLSPPELVTIFGQLSALTNAEGAISGLVAYEPPSVLTLLLYVVFFAYYFLLLLGKLSHTADDTETGGKGWNSLWIIAVLIISNFGLYQISRAYANPFNIRAGNGTQKPLISNACRDTERVIDQIHSAQRTSGPGARVMVTDKNAETEVLPKPKRVVSVNLNLTSLTSLTPPAWTLGSTKTTSKGQYERV